MLVECKGTLDFNLDDLTKKQKNQSVWKRTAIIKTNCDLYFYYSWFIKKRFNLHLNKPIRTPHITFISDRMETSIFDQVKEIFNGKEITFYYDISPKTNGKHWWLKVFCAEAESIRMASGLSKKPFYDFHLTLGLPNEKNINHSIYIYNQSKKWNLLDFNDEKFENYDILKVY